MKTQEVINKLNEAFLPKNIECDGAYCTGCWKDVIRQAITMLQEAPTAIPVKEQPIGREDEIVDFGIQTFRNVQMASKVELLLKPEAMNSVFTWKQIQDAIMSDFKD